MVYFEPLLVDLYTIANEQHSAIPLEGATATTT